MQTSKFINSLISIAALLTLNLAAALEVQPQTAEGISAENPLASYTLSAAGVSKNGLTWQRCLVGQSFDNGECTGTATEYDSWEKALNAVSKEQQQQGWRVANIKELLRIVEPSKAYPALDSEVFPFAKTLKFAVDAKQFSPTLSAPSSAFIWSSTPVAHSIVKKAGWSYTTVANSRELTAKSRAAANLAWALDLSVGMPATAYRDGQSRGEHETTEYNTPDPDHVEKARYVLLVKDAE